MTQNNGLFTKLIVDSLNNALEIRKSKIPSLFVDGENTRDYKCSVNNCTRNAYAKGFCNAHYIRFRAGKNMDDPLTERKRQDICNVCGEKTGFKGGWGLCPKHYKKDRVKLIKQTLIDLMGGKCVKCNGQFPLEVFDFHHIGEKMESPSYSIGSLSIEKIADEINKCTLLCANCHRIEHAREL
jgi:hypothetical protein